MSQGAAVNTERDSQDAVGVNPQASPRSRRPQESAALSDKTGKPEDAHSRLKSSLRPHFRHRGFSRRASNGPPSSNAPESVPCKFFSKNGHCRNGDRCRYSHELGEQSSAATAVTTEKPGEKEVEDVAPIECTDKSVERPPPKEPCRFFERRGFCRYGRGCRYVHKRRCDQVKSTAQAPREATMNDSPQPESGVLDPLASDQKPVESVSEVGQDGSAQQPPSEEELLKQLR